MAMNPPMDPAILGVCAVAGAFAALSLGFWMKSRTARKQADALAAELAAIRGAPVEKEYRIEQFDVLWFPKVVFEPGSGEEARAAAGLPHCVKCVQPLKAGAGGGAWACPACGGSHPASVTDLTVTGTIEKTALRYFCERPPRGVRKS